MKKLIHEYMCFSLRDAFEEINLPEGLSSGSEERLSRAIYHCSLPRNDSYKTLEEKKRGRKKVKENRERKGERKRTMDVRKSERRTPLCGPKDPERDGIYRPQASKF